METELAEIGRSWRSSFRGLSSSFRSSSLNDDDAEDDKLQWTEIERLPTIERLRFSLFDKNSGRISNAVVADGDDGGGKRVVDVTKLGTGERHAFMEKLIRHIQNDNLRLLQKVRRRIDKVGVKLPNVEVRYKNLHVEAECEVVHGKPLPTLWHSAKNTIFDFAKMFVSKSNRAKISIIDNVSGIIKPGRITLLLGPPGCGKTSLLKALSGNLDKSLQVTGEVSYNGYKLEEFVPQKTSAYISQNDVHLPHMTVRETLDFSAQCQGVGSREEIMLEVIRTEKEEGIVPDPEIDTYMKATSIRRLKTTLQTDYILRILGLDICADILVGDAMKRGVSGGQKKRLTTGEMTVGPVRALFMDEITNGLDSLTTFQIVSCLQQLAHITDATVLVSILQPAAETFELFDDIILMAEGKILYHGPRDCVLEFFYNCGFRCPERKGVADFLQEVISKKDQAQYWHRVELPYSYFSVDMFSRKFKESPLGKELDEKLSVPYDKSKSHKNAISFSAYSISKWELFRVCMSRELLYLKRNSFVYVFKTCQLAIVACITMTVFLHTRTSNNDALHATYYMGALFFALNLFIVDGFPQVSMTVARLAHFYKQKELYFYPAWAFAIPVSILKLPHSFIEALVWTSLTYYVIGYSHEVWRFFRHFLILFALHLTSLSIFQFVASVFQTHVASISASNLAVYSSLLLGGFIITRPSMPIWLKWGFWVSPITYGEIGLSLNEFLAPKWQKILSTNTTNTTIGKETLESRGLNFNESFYWISLGALFGFALILNIGFSLALTFLDRPGSSRAVISHEKLSKIQKSDNEVYTEEKCRNSPSANKESEGRTVLPFEPLSMAFQDVGYYVDTPLEMRKRGFVQRKLELLSDVTGALRPGVLTALMGVSGAGKTTLLDVLAGRKTTGYIEGEIKVGGYPKVQETFARISGYCEQTDIHSPQITVEESLIFSAYLRLAPEIDLKTKVKFVSEVLETIELDEIKDALVGTPGSSGLSTEQRKRLTIAVELVANPSIIFMDEPTTGLDARAAAIVMRAVRNVVDTGRTIVCTIHQPSIDIFESFDELILLKSGGRIIYSGPLGEHSTKVIEYFEGVSGVPKIAKKDNPATWMLEVTSTSAEAKLGVDFAQIYKDSTFYESNKEFVRKFSAPPPGSRDLHFPTRFPQNGWGQFKFCLWKQHLSYWRNPSYNMTRVARALVGSLLIGTLYWGKGKNVKNQQDILNILGSMYASIMFFGMNSCSAIIPIAATERTVMYREKYAGMYSTWAYALAQVTVEVPYVFIQTALFMVSAYPMIGYDGSAYKVFWYFYTMFCSLLFFVNFGMLLVSLTPTSVLATILAAAFYKMFNLFAGLMIPKPQIPKWWIWMYYLIPSSWSLNGLMTSQYGDIDKEIAVFGETKSVVSFLEEYFGYHHDHLAISAVLLPFFPLLVALLFAYFIGRLNFQQR